MATGDTRYGRNPGTGANEPKHHEKKERPERGWVSRQGGDQTRGTEDQLARERADRARVEDDR